MAVRVRYQNESALKIATYLSKHSAVAHVNYPGLESHAQHSRAKEWFEGYGGVISFELQGGVEAAEKMFKRLTMPAVAVSLGGVDSLIILPAAAVHPNVSDEDRAKTGLSQGLIRFSTGLENTDDLIADFEQAMKE